MKSIDEVVNIEVNGDINLMSSKIEITNGIYKPRKSFLVFKRIFDILGSLFLLLITLPIILSAIILIYIESPGSVIYKQRRLGYRNQEFWIYKLRSMGIDAEKFGAQWAIPEDPRITRVGKVIRMTRIDELPQLVNVIKGDMSLVGPRPERKVFVEEFIADNPEFKLRTMVKPGLTGLAQVNGGYDLKAHEKLMKDLYYIKHCSIKMDLKILIKTVKVIITGEGAR